MGTHKYAPPALDRVSPQSPLEWRLGEPRLESILGRTPFSILVPQIVHLVNEAVESSL